MNTINSALMSNPNTYKYPYYPHEMCGYELPTHFFVRLVKLSNAAIRIPNDYTWQ